MIYEEPKVDVIEFVEGEIVTDVTKGSDDGKNHDYDSWNS